jgi:phosphodiesterase/alkaline phosphatase D-like protein
MRVTGMTRKLSLAVLATSAVVCTALAAPAASMAASAPVFEQQLPVTGITRTTATVWAQLNPGESETAYEVRFGVDESLGRHTPQYNAGSGSTAVTVNAGLLGLTPGTPYYYEFVATNSEGTTVGPLETFTTAPPTPPTATTGGASEVTLTTATVSGTIAARGLPTSYELDLGTDATYGTSMYGEAGSGSEPAAIALALTGLAPGTTYHYRIDAINSDGRSYGADETFTTPVYDKPIVLPPTAPLLATPPIAFPAEGANTAKPTIRKKHKHKHKKHHGNRKHRRTRHKKKR